MRKLLFIFMIIFGFFACSEEMDPDVKMAYDIMNNFGKEKATKDKMFLHGIGGRFITGVEVLSVDFITYQNLKLEEARKLYVRTVEELVEKMNTHEKIRPYLKDYPATYQNVEVSIAFENASKKWYVDPPNIAYISCAISEVAVRAGLSCQPFPVTNGCRPAWIFEGEKSPIPLTLSDIVFLRKITPTNHQNSQTALLRATFSY